MEAGHLLCGIGYALGFLGLAFVYAHWRAHRRAWMVAGWLLVACGALCCMNAMAPERGLAHACIAFALGGAVLTLIERRQQAARPIIAANGRGRIPVRSRFDRDAAGRLGGSLILAPAAALAIGWMIVGLPGEIANRLALALVTMALVLAAALIAVTALRRPWITNGALGLIAVAPLLALMGGA